MSTDLKVVTTYEDFLVYADDYALMFSDYFVWNVQSRYDFRPEVFEKNATRMNTSLAEIIDRYKRIRLTGTFPKEQHERIRGQFDDGQWLLLLYVDEQLMGMTRLYCRSDKEMEVHGVYVDPSCRGSGYGSILVNESINIAKSEDFDVIYLETMPFMRSAIRLYQSRGFDQVDYIDFPQYTPDRAKEIGVVFMQLRI